MALCYMYFIAIVCFVRSKLLHVWIFLFKCNTNSILCKHFMYIFFYRIKDLSDVRGAFLSKIIFIKKHLSKYPNM